MTNKAYIVANEQQEREVLEKLEREGLKWRFKSKPTEWVPTRNSYFNVQFPYVLFNDDGVVWGEMSELEDNYEIVYDGRKEEQMSDKYVVSQKFMNDLKDWKDTLTKHIKPGYFIDFDDLSGLSETVYMWWGDEVSDEESNNRLIAIIRWVNGEDVFEVEKQKKWVVRSKETDYSGKYGYIEVDDFAVVLNRYNIDDATNFDTKEEAESWANSHQEVIEVEE